MKAAATPNGPSQQVEIFELVDAFNTPRLILDPVQRKLLVDTQPRNIHATAEVRMQCETSKHGTLLLLSCAAVPSASAGALIPRPPAFPRRRFNLLVAPAPDPAPPLLCPLQFKHQLYLQRLHLVHQRLQRNRMFQQNNMLLPNSAVGRGPSVQVRAYPPTPTTLHTSLGP